MNINEKITLCLSDELIENKILTENEKKVLASLLYSYKVSKKAKDNIVIRAMDAIRKDIQINKNDMYEAVRNLETIYHMIERTPGESRGKEKSKVASVFKLNFDVIFNPPKEPIRFDFSKEIKSSKTSINTTGTGTGIGTIIDIGFDIGNTIDSNVGISSDTLSNISSSVGKSSDTLSNIRKSKNIKHDDNSILDNILVNQNDLKEMENKEKIIEYQAKEAFSQWARNIKYD